MSNRVIHIVIILYKRYSLQIVDGYALTGNSEYETFYEDSIRARRRENTQFIIVI